jgi:histidinol-phosphate aminotransferase
VSASLQTLVPPYIESLSPYVPGKPVEELERELGITGALKVASNENPLGPSPLAAEAARAAIADVNQYPDGGGFTLRQLLAARHGVGLDEIVLGAGSNEIIDMLVRTFCRAGIDEVVTHRYAFFMYKVSCASAGVTMHEADATAELGCDVDALLAKVKATPATKLVFLHNPNNPTGSYIPRADFERLLAGMPAGVILCVDEAYFEYAEKLADYPTAEPYRKTAKPMIIWLRTFSKAYGLAGLRVGYGVADTKIVGYLNRVRMPFNVPSPAQAAAIAALNDVAHVDRSRALNTAGVKQLIEGAQKLGVKPYPSAGNFVLIDVGRPAGPVYQAMLQKGVIVRPLAPAGLLNHVRISVAGEADNARSLAALAAALAT